MTGQVYGWTACAACGEQFLKKSSNAKYCQTCKDADPHRNRTRQKLQKMIVFVDLEGRRVHEHMLSVKIKNLAKKVPDMQILTASFGREDGTSGSIESDDPRVIMRWLIDNLSGHYIDQDGNEFEQVIQAFHFNWDAAMLTKNFNPMDLFLIHKAQARTNNLLCATHHENGVRECGKLHRFDPKDIETVITEGGEGDVIAWDEKSMVAFAATPKRRFYIEMRPQGDRYEGWKRVDIHDVGSAFTGGLERVIKVWQPELTQAQRDIIAWGKRSRKSGFLDGPIEQIMAYSEAECVAGARCARKLLTALGKVLEINPNPAKLFGSGSVASMAMSKYEVLTREETHCDAWIDEIAWLAYFGGLIDTPVVGRVVGPVHQVDINSAYPSVMVPIPCMREGHGRWEVIEGDFEPPDGPVLGYVLASWDWRRKKKASTPPFVVHSKPGAVFSPDAQADVWVTMAEYQAAFSKYPDDIKSGVMIWWVPECDCPSPFAWMDELYDRRRQVKADRDREKKYSAQWHELNALQEAIKLVLNSCYGKLAQTRPEPGRYTNLHYASHITGATRAKVRLKSWEVEAKGGTVVYQHTDSVLYLNGPEPEGGPDLGDWGVEDSSFDQVLLQPGLTHPLQGCVCDPDPDKADHGGGKSASRGVRAHSFYEEVHKWADRTDFTSRPTSWALMTVDQEAMVSRRMAVHRGRPEYAGVFLPAPKEVGVGTTMKRWYEKASLVKGEPEAWKVPPPPTLPDDMLATIEDRMAYQSLLARRLKEGVFDTGNVEGDFAGDVEDVEFIEDSWF